MMLIRLTALVGLSLTLMACGPSDEEKSAAAHQCKIVELTAKLAKAPAAEKAKIQEEMLRTTRYLKTQVELGATPEGIAKAVKAACPDTIKK